MRNADVRDLRREFIDLLKQHDWHYGRADDPRQYQIGREQRERILAIMPHIPDGEALYRAASK